MSHVNMTIEEIAREVLAKCKPNFDSLDLSRATAAIAPLEAELKQAKGKLLTYDRMAAAGVWVETQKYSDMVARLAMVEAALEEIRGTGDSSRCLPVWRKCQKAAEQYFLDKAKGAQCEK